MTYKNMVRAGGTVMDGMQMPGSAPGSRFIARTFLATPRFARLDRAESFFECRQHDHKKFAFDGNIITDQGIIQTTQPTMGDAAGAFVGLWQRRPSSPLRLGKTIVNSFTNMVFGENRFPKTKVSDDDTQQFYKALIKEMKLPVRMIRVRNLGGSAGTVGLSWCFVNGKPRCRAHKAKYLHVHAWEDRDDLLPRHVTELYQGCVEEWDGRQNKYVENFYWYRKDWTPNADVVFNPCKVDPDIDPEQFWQSDEGIDVDRSVEHNEGRTHFEWIQNVPSEDIDGEPDYDGVYDKLDTIDVLSSVLAKGAILNLDPTLVLKMDPDMLNALGIRKGSENGLAVGNDGDAKYLEISGDGMKAGSELLMMKRRGVLEETECVVPEPDETTIGTSSVARKVRYAPMLSRSDMLREQYGAPIVRMLEQMAEIARTLSKRSVSFFDEDGNEQEAQPVLDLPPRVETTPVLDEDGNPTGDEDVKQTDHDPGEGEDLDLQWGNYFPPTPQDQQSIVTSLAAATANAPFMSAETATEIVMEAFGREVGDEKTRVAQEAMQKQSQTDDMFNPDAPGGKVNDPSQLPPGAAPKPPKGGGGGAPPPAAGAKPPAAPGEKDGSAKNAEA